MPASIADRAEDPTWTTRRWTTVKEISAAFVVGAIESSSGWTGTASHDVFFVPRYLEHVCRQLADHLVGLMNDEDITQVAPLQVERMLLSFCEVNAVVRCWRLNHAQVAYRAADYLRGKAALEAAEDE